MPTVQSFLADRRPRTAFQQRLLDWFDLSRRDLPWRKDRDPYRIWVSEIMLQQTTVATVKRRFDAFVERFPNVKVLAAADEAAVLQAWEGLGYYRRARNLHASAKIIVAEHGGAMPDDPSVWSNLPGVGRYMLGAVMSQAFERRLPVVEANTIRVLARLTLEEGDPTSGPVKARLWDVAKHLLPHKRVGDFNQAIMELGAIVCTPTNPQCNQCPVRADCRAASAGRQERIPLKKSAKQWTPIRESAAVVVRAGAVLVVQRPEGGRWAGMWEFPGGELLDDESPELGLVRVMHDRYGVKISTESQIAALRYAVTRYRVSLSVWEATMTGSRRFPKNANHRWVRPGEFGSIPFSTAHRKIARMIESGSRQRRLF